MAAKPTNLKEWLALARSVVPRRAEDLQPKAHELEAAMQESVDKAPLIYRTSWQGPFGSHWLGRVRVTEHRSRLNLILYWIGDEGCEAIDVKADGVCFHYAPSLFRSYASAVLAEHTEEECAETYFHKNFHLTLQRLTPARDPRARYAGITPEGLVFGQVHGDLISLTEFVHTADMRTAQKNLYETLELFHELQDLPLDMVQEMQPQLEQSLAALRLGVMGDA